MAKKATKPAKKKVSAVAKPVVIKKVNPVKDKQTKSQIISAIADDAGVEKKTVKAIFESLDRLAQAHLMNRGSGELTIPEVGVKLRRVKKKATKARKGRNPFTGEEITIKAKPARNVVRVTALKKLKELAEA
ncbi:MAG: HU family DNA-binding protein [Gammaproteobacteria bacterium]